MHLTTLRVTGLLSAAIALSTSIVMLGACARPAAQADSRERTLDDLSPEARPRLAAARVFFAHQSVGDNIVEGMAAVVNDDPALKLNIIDLAAASATTGSYFAHAKLGKNGDPQSKTRAFASALEDRLGDRLDVAFQKYCFADADETTDAAALFDYYSGEMKRLRARFPRTTFVHVTMPLLEVQGGPRALVKKMLGRTPDHYADNAVRERFNDLMRSRYLGKEPLFDLAALESSRPAGPREAIQFRSGTVYSLLPDYTDDGAHLNQSAERRVATQLLVFLGDLLESRRPGALTTRADTAADAAR